MWRGEARAMQRGRRQREIDGRLRWTLGRWGVAPCIGTAAAAVCYCYWSAPREVCGRGGTRSRTSRELGRVASAWGGRNDGAPRNRTRTRPETAYARGAQWHRCRATTAAVDLGDTTEHDVELELVSEVGATGRCRPVEMTLTPGRWRQHTHRSAIGGLCRLSTCSCKCMDLLCPVDVRACLAMSMCAVRASGYTQEFL